MCFFIISYPIICVPDRKEGSNFPHRSYFPKPIKKKPVLTTIPVYTRGIYENLLRCIVIDGLQCIRCIFCKDGLFHYFYYFRCIIQIITGSMIKQA